MQAFGTQRANYSISIMTSQCRSSKKGDQMVAGLEVLVIGGLGMLVSMALAVAVRPKV
jgi:hypothetical protein